MSRGVSSTQLRSGATGTIADARPSSILQPPVTPSLVSLGLTFGQVNIRSLPIAAARTQLVVPVAAKGAKRIPTGTQVGHPLGPDPARRRRRRRRSAARRADAPPSRPIARRLRRDPSSPAPDRPRPTSTSSSPSSWARSSRSPRRQRTGKGLNVGVTYPSAPGLYRLVVTLHNSTGVAYDAPTQSKLTSALVRVGGLYSAAFGAPTSLALAAGSTSTVGVRVVNAGSQGWDAESDRRRRPSRTRC